MLPMDPVDSIGLLSNPSPLRESTLPVSSYDKTSVNSNGFDCTSCLIFRLDSIGLKGFVNWNLVESIGHVWIDNDRSLGRAERSSLQSKEIICVGKLFHC